MDTDIMTTKINNDLHCSLLLAQTVELTSPIFERKRVEIYWKISKPEGIMQNATACQSVELLFQSR